MANLLVACEESQIIARAFREKGYDAFSCDIKECSGGHPEYHIHSDVFTVIDGGEFLTQDGVSHFVEKWDMMIAHPPCTYLCVSGNRWFAPDVPGSASRYEKQNEAIDFFMSFVRAPVKRKCIENPIGVMSSLYRKPDQIIQPYQFGDPVQKSTCLWLFGLPALRHTCIVEPEMYTSHSGKTCSLFNKMTFGLPAEERSCIRSKTFPGIAHAMAEQWSDFDFTLF